MKKKLLLTFLIFLLSCAAVFAKSNNFRLSFGATFSFNEINREDAEDSIVYAKNLISTGLESRMYIKAFSLDLVGEFSVLDRQTLFFSGLLSAGVSGDLGNTVALGIYTGPNIEYIFRDTGNKAIGEDGEASSDLTFFQALGQGYFHYRLTLDVIIGPVMRVGIAYTVPTGFNLERHSFAKLLPSAENWKEGKFTASIQMHLI